MEPFKAPSLTANPADNWCGWEQSFRRYIAASEGKDEQGKMDVLLHTVGEDVLEVFNTLTAFKDHCSPPRNVVFERLQYWSHQRTAGTPVNTFITELRLKSKDCEFGISENDMLRDKLMLSITDCHLQHRLLQERRLTLHRAIEICRATEREKTPSQVIKTEHGVQEVPVDGEMKPIPLDKSLVLAAFTPQVHLHRFQLQQPSDTVSVFSERTNVPEQHLHFKEEPEMLSEGQEEKQLGDQQETNSAACPVKCEDEEEKPQASQQHWRQLTEMNMKEEPSTCSLDELKTRHIVGVNGKGPEAAQNPEPSSLVPQGPDVAETDSSQTEDSGEDDEDCWSKPLSEAEAEADFDSTKKKGKMSDSSKKAEMGFTFSKTQISSFQQICSKATVQVKITPECVGGEKASLSAASDLIIHTGAKPFTCDVCRKCFIGKHHLQAHMMIHTGEKPFKCGICSTCWNRKSDLNKHMRTHLGEKPFKCDVCSKCFIRNQHLQIHMRIHTGEKPYKCDVCMKCFAQKYDLDRHLRSHTGVKPFECGVCSKCFSRKANVNAHMRTHTGVKPFECGVCSKCFTHKTNLTIHMRIHTGEKPYECDVCRKCFIQKRHLQLHVRIHKEVEPFEM